MSREAIRCCSKSKYLECLLLSQLALLPNDAADRRLAVVDLNTSIDLGDFVVEVHDDLNEEVFIFTEASTSVQHYCS